MTRIYYKGAQAIVLMYDMTNLESFDNAIKIWKPMIEENAPQDAKIILVGNKKDLTNKRLVLKKKGEEIA